MQCSYNQLNSIFLPIILPVPTGMIVSSNWNFDFEGNLSTTIAMLERERVAAI